MITGFGMPEAYPAHPGTVLDLRRLSMILAPQSMVLSGRKNTTNMQFASAALWDVASTIDPFFITDGLDWFFGLSCQ